MVIATLQDCKLPGRGQWDFKAAEAVRTPRPGCRNLNKSTEEAQPLFLGPHTRDPHSSTVLGTHCHHSWQKIVSNVFLEAQRFLWTLKRGPSRQMR